ncbi:MAG: ATP-dependent DNA helicase [Nanoarchaeota archaeon]
MGTSSELAIRKITGPCAVLAGAGTGKTHLIVEKIKYLVSNKIYKPEKIVCITFSNEAANNLLTRIQKSIDVDKDKEPTVKTFHAFSAELLRKYGDKIGINKEFKIIDPNEAKIVMHLNLKVTPANCHKYIGSIGSAKDIGIGIEEIKSYLERKTEKYHEIDLEKRMENLNFELQTLYLTRHKDRKLLVNEILEIKEICDIKKFINAWTAYEKIKKLKNYQDYSDLNKNALDLLKKFPEISQDFEYLIVDEFQDTNKIQLELLFYLAPKGDISAVGDINQSIYRFRGAYKRNFQEFIEHFKIKDDIFNLDKSYRSPNKILKAAHQIIKNNYDNSEECFIVKNAFDKPGGKIEVYELQNAREEARKVSDIVEDLLKRGEYPNEICIMFRAHQYGRIIKQALENKGIKYCAVSKSSLLKQKTVKTIFDYLSILNKLKMRKGGGEHEWWDLIYNLDFKSDDLVLIGKFLKENRNSENTSAKILNEIGKLELSEEGKREVNLLCERIKLMIPCISKELPEIIKYVFLCSGIITGTKTKEEKENIFNLNKFYELSKNHSSLYDSDLNGFIYYLEIIQSLGIEIEAPQVEDNGVRLMTLHATKGLEYNTVIITNAAQKRFPIERAVNRPLIPLELYPEFKGLKQGDRDYYAYELEREYQLHEERRLCYVAFTRAKENLILTYAGKYGGRMHYASQFLNEINYKTNPDVIFYFDKEEKYKEFLTKDRNQLTFNDVLNKDNFSDLVIDVKGNTKRKIENLDIIFSPSSLLLFTECQKKYEYKYVYNMPEEKTIYWEAMRLGSFVHKVAEAGVKNNFVSFKEFIDYAKELHIKNEWESVDFNEAEHLIRVFFERNKKKYSKNSKTEQKLDYEFEGIKFTGFADRIDFNSDGLEIIDYKTGQSDVAQINRNWQLGFYALSASRLGKVRKITLDLLRHQKPLEFYVDSEGNAKAVYSDRMSFNIYSIKDELVKTAKLVLEAYKNTFKACSVEKNCSFCNEYVYK